MSHFSLYAAFGYNGKIDVTAEPYNADNTGVTSSASAIQNAIDASGESVSLYFPAGIYKIEKTIVVREKALSFKGDGKGITELRFTNNVDVGISFYIDHINRDGNLDKKDYIQPANFTDLSITTTNDVRGIALELKWADAVAYGGDEYAVTSYTSNRGIIENVEIRGVNPVDNGWNVGIFYENGTNVFLTNVSIFGKNYGGDENAGRNNIQSDTGIAYEGNHPVELHMTDCQTNNWKIGLHIPNEAEGIYINGSTFVKVFTGIKWFVQERGELKYNGTKKGNGLPLLTVGDSHISAYDYGIYAKGVSVMTIHDNLIYIRGGFAVHLEDGVQNIIHSNNFQAIGTKNDDSNGIFIGANEQYNHIYGNNFISSDCKANCISATFSTGIWLFNYNSPATPKNNVIENNIFTFEPSFLPIYDQTSGLNIIKNNNYFFE